MKLTHISILTLLLLVSSSTIIAQAPIAEIEGHLQVRGSIDIHHAVDSTVVLIGYQAGAFLSEEIVDRLDTDGMYFPSGTTMVGTLTGQNSEGVFNSYYGYGAGQNSGVGSLNSFFGVGSGNRTTTNENAFYGYQSGVLNTNGLQNTFLGANSGFNNTLGSYNTYIGKGTGVNNQEGSGNTYVGWQAGSRNVNGNGNTMIGESADYSSGIDSLDFAIAIGYNAKVACDHCAAIGGIDDDAVNVGIGVAAPLSRLHVVQKSVGPTTGLRLEVHDEMDTITANMYLNLSRKLNFSIDNQRVGYIDDVTGDYMATSDANLKTNISAVGSILDKIMMLNPVWYHYIRNGSDEPQTLGFLAQDVQEYFPTLVGTTEENMSLSYSKFGVLAIKAIQEQQKIITALQDQLNFQNHEIKRLIEQMKKIDIKLN